MLNFICSHEMEPLVCTELCIATSAMSAVDRDLMRMRLGVSTVSLVDPGMGRPGSQG